jgi:NAD(P)-dependent dehydrogenase (short-subunit alcohol dehydrogenase family)
MTPRTVLITGCSTGIGRACAERLARGGHTVYATARRLESIEDLKVAGCRTLALDVTDEASMRAAVEAVEAEQGAVGALVNNAGYSQSGAVETLSMDDLRRQFETNVFGLVRMCQLVLPAMRAQRWGRIVNMSSMGGRLVFPGGGIYHASKYAVEAISDALRFEVAGFGVRVVVVEPGTIRTQFAQAATSALDSATTAAAVDADARGGDAARAYGDFNAAVARSTQEAYERGPLALLGGEPGDVAEVVEKAITSERPRPRYKVTPSAHLLVGQRRLLGDRGWDAFLATQFRRPR